MTLMPLAWHRDMHHYKHKDIKDLDKLWIITMVSNPIRYCSRYNLFCKFKEYIEKCGANLFIVEIAQGDRSFEVTSHDNPNHLQLRTNTILWHKERALNLAIQNLPKDFKYVAWVDSDITFLREDWLEETVHQLQHYKVIQMFQNAIDLGPNGEIMKTHEGFMYAHVNKLLNTKSGTNYNLNHPGFCWAATRSAINDLGMLFDVAILGSGDHSMAWGLIGQSLQHTPKQISEGYKRELKVWEERANIHIRGNVGYMPGIITHFFHGAKKNRFYQQRWSILLQHNYDPDYDIKCDVNGLHQFSHAGERMRDDIYRYFSVRNEDSIDI